MTEKDIQEITYLITNYIPNLRAYEPKILKHISKNLKRNKCHLYYGAYKMVLMSKKFIDNFVIKILFNYFYNIKDEKFVEIDKDIDYCLSECEVFEKMKKIGLDCFFAKTSYFGNIKNIPIYTQEKVITYENKSFEHSKSGYRNLKNICLEVGGKIGYDPYALFEEIMIMPLDWWTKAIDYYGKDKTQSLIQLIGEDDLDMSLIWGDLHYGNFGFRDSDSSPCLLDFSGYSHTGCF